MMAYKILGGLCIAAGIGIPIVGIAVLPADEAKTTNRHVASLMCGGALFGIATWLMS